MVAAIDRILAHIWRVLPQWAQGHIDGAYSRVLLVGMSTIENPQLPPEYEAVTSRLSVVVPIHDAVEDTERCLRTLHRFAGGAEVILVDDGSTDARMATLLTTCQREWGWKLLRNERGTLHSAACTRGVDAAAREVLCLLNSDTVITHRSFAAPICLLFGDPSIGAVGPAISQGWGPQLDLQAKRCRYLLSDEKIFGRAEWRARQFGNRPPRELPKYVDGCAFFISRENWDAVGGFSDCRPHWGNDVDLCRKLAGRGLRLVACDSAYIHHLGGRSRD